MTSEITLQTSHKRSTWFALARSNNQRVHTASTYINSRIDNFHNCFTIIFHHTKFAVFFFSKKNRNPSIQHQLHHLLFDFTNINRFTFVTIIFCNFCIFLRQIVFLTSSFFYCYIRVVMRKKCRMSVNFASISSISFVFVVIRN